MKKMIVMLLIAILTLSATAFAATYNYEDDIRFEYDESAFDITMEDHTDDEDLVILIAKDESWGETFIRIHLGELRDGETSPTMDDFTAMPDATDIPQGEWNGFKDVFMYTVNNTVNNFTEHFFIAPVIDDDGEIDAILTVDVGVSPIEDEDTAMTRDDLISAVLDTLKVDD